MPPVLDRLRRRLPLTSAATHAALVERVEQLTAAVTALTASMEALGQRDAEQRAQMQTLQHAVTTLAQREVQLRAVLRRDVALAGALPSLEQLLSDPAIERHVRQAIEGAELRMRPFPFAVVDNLLPEALYSAVLEAIPPEELFADQPFNKQELHVPLDLAPQYSARVWEFLWNVVVQRYVAPAVTARFEAPLDAWIARHWPGVTWRTLKPKVSNGRLMLRGRGYRIPPHRDPKWGFLVCLFYLSRPGDNESWGTQLYSVDDDVEAASALPYWIDQGRCHLVEDVAFRPNRLLVFLNSDGAHGAEIPADAPESLRRYAYQFRIGPNASSLERLVAQLPPEKRTRWARQ